MPSINNQADVSALISFGVDPSDAFEKARGAAVYSVPYCLKSENTNNQCKKDASCNCHWDGTNDRAQQIINAIQITWQLPYSIPNDQTEVSITFH